MRNAMAAGIAITILLTGCAAKELPPEELAKLQGGTTSVVVYGFCVPMDHLIKTTMYRYTLTFVVNGQKVGTMQSCSFGTFNVKSGYWDTSFEQGGGFPKMLFKQIYKPGTTQYLHMYPAGYGTFNGEWVTKEQADQGIAEIRKIGQVF